MNNSSGDDRVISEDGKWAIIEAGDCWDGLSRSKTRDNIGDAISAPWDAGMTVMPGPGSVAAKKLVKVKLADLLANPANPTPPRPAVTGLPSPKDFKKDPVAPQSPFMSKPYTAKNIPEFPHQCRVCGGRFYQGLTKVVHESTEKDPKLQGACPGTATNTEKRRLRA